jgi:uncharacterized phiE125 gp8 family phage protein
MFNAVIFIEPASEPITVAQLKQHSRVTSAAEDTLCAQMIAAARRWCESYTKRVFINQTWDLFLDYFPCALIELPMGKLQAITHVKYKDDQGVLQTLDTSKYQYSTAGIVGRLAPAYEQVWPATRPVLDAVQIRAVFGYGADADAVPANIKQAIYLLAAHFYQNREALIVGSGVDAKEVPLGVKSLLMSGDKLFA